MSVISAQGFYLAVVSCVFFLFFAGHTHTDHGCKLEKDIMGDTSGHYQRMLVILLQVRGEQHRELERGHPKRQADGGEEKRKK